ncbi:hypothetical protein CDQ68_04585 [Campylobacter hyointestinalis subsp. hyointestinalis]|uniref:hypothetical protein n=1 Tax=Campylobacter hyointestinalis TaxID=198 RepID=UPI000CE539AB|nr:hypothetical protein [Campylobacter hyointestinalis]PPB52081.1 hypothetical protein CDQ68_04585 [Campylobacter hyointestinalis subsp. hyointestinalis]
MKLNLNKQTSINSKRLIILFFILSLIVTIFVTTINFIVDPYGFYDKNNLSRQKINIGIPATFKTTLLANGNFDAIMLGTSRIGVMDPIIVNDYLNANTFNLSYPGSNTEIQNKLFKYAHYYNPSLKYLIYSIDFMSFNANRDKSGFKEFYDLKRKIEKFEKINNYLYFNSSLFVKSIKLILSKQAVDTMYLSNGMRDYANYIKDLENGKFDLDDKIKREIDSYFAPNGTYRKYKFSNEFLNYFKDMLEYCKKHNIKVFLYIPPMYSKHFDAIYMNNLYDEFELFKKELVKISNFIDFTGHNTISKNKNNYWDSSHLRRETTQIIMARIFNDKSVEVPDDFGVLVTKDNIEEHLSNLRKQINFHDSNKNNR